MTTDQPPVTISATIAQGHYAEVEVSGPSSSGVDRGAYEINLQQSGHEDYEPDSIVIDTQQARHLARLLTFMADSVENVGADEGA